MESDPNPFPTIDLFPRITRVAKAIGGLFCLHQLASHGDHFVENTGGGPLLDRELYDQPRVIYHSDMGDTIDSRHVK